MPDVILIMIAILLGFIFTMMISKQISNAAFERDTMLQKEIIDLSKRVKVLEEAYKCRIN